MSTCRLKTDFLDIPASPHELYVTYSRYDGDWQSVIHTHSYTEFLFVENGYGEMIFEDKTYPISQNDFVIIPPNRRHTEKSSRDGRLEYYVLGVTNLKVQSDENFTPVVSLGAQSETIHRLLIDMYRELQQQSPGYKLFVESLYLQFAVYLSRKKHIVFEFEEGAEVRREIGKTIEYLKENYMYDLAVEDMAEVANMSLFHFIREFSRNTGKTPLRYLAEIRVNEAKALLKSTDLDMGTIAKEIGFSNASYFSQRFKAVTGTTPIRFRNSRPSL